MVAHASNNNLKDGKQLLTQWQMQSTMRVPQAGNVLSLRTYKPQRWHNATVPTSVLGALVKENVYPDPHFDLNDLRIPDASDDLNRRLGLSKYSHIKGVSNPCNHYIGHLILPFS